MASVMAKRKNDRRNPAFLRYGPKQVAEIERYVEDLKIRAAELQAIADAMRQEKIDQVEMDGVTKFDRAIPLLDSFSTLLEAAVIDAKKARRRGE